MLEQVTQALRDALVAAATAPVIRQRLLDYEHAFDRWTQACQSDLTRSSFDQRADSLLASQEARDDAGADSENGKLPARQRLGSPRCDDLEGAR